MRLEREPVVVDERLGHLEDVDRQPLQRVQRRVAGPEVVDRDPHAERAQALELGDAEPRVLEQRALGDLEHELARVDPGVLDPAGDARHEVGVAQLGGGEVDVHQQAAGLGGALPALELA